MTSTATYSLAEQIACVRREIAMRERVYPRWVNAGKMSQNKADTELGCMRAVLATLEKLHADPMRVAAGLTSVMEHWR